MSVSINRNMQITRVFVIIIVFFWALSAFPQTLVLYPETKDIAEKKIFTIIVEGIESKKKDVLVEKIDPTFSAEIIKEKRGDYTSLIILGTEISSHIDPDDIGVPWSIGMAPQLNKSVLQEKEISIFPEPGTVIDSIIQINPAIKTVFTVVSSKKGLLRAEKARDNAREKSIVVKIKHANNAKEVARHWLLISNDINPENQALWIGDSTLLSESRAFSYLLKSSWKKKFMLASSIAAHARRGVSLGFAPDLKKYGQALLNALDQAQPTESKAEGFIQVVVNERTLNHLGLRLPENTDQFIDMVIHR